jgi:hypothetical protein
MTEFVACLILGFTNSLEQFSEMDSDFALIEDTPLIARR